jgi:hypothetical protein
MSVLGAEFVCDHLFSTKIYIILYNLEHGYERNCKISGSHGVEYEMIVFWDVAPCSLVEAYGSFRGSCCLHRQGTHP